jgi:hypothetical protein
MIRRRFLIFMCAMFAVATLFWGVDQGWAQSPTPKSNKELKYTGKITPAEKKAAAARAAALGLKPGVAGMNTATPTGLQPEVDRSGMKGGKK